MSQSEKNNPWKQGVVLSFDLFTDKLRSFYSETAPQGAYSDIKHYLLKNGFTHLKDSDYRNENISKRGTMRLLFEFSMKNKWFPLSVNKIIISPNVIQLDVSSDIQALKDEAWAKEKTAPSKSVKKESLDEKFSRLDEKVKKQSVNRNSKSKSKNSPKL